MLIAHVVHEDGHEADYALMLGSAGTLRNAMMNPDGVVMLGDGSLLRTRDWMKVTVEKPQTLPRRAVEVLGNKEYAKLMESVDKVITDTPEYASKSFMMPRFIEVAGATGTSIWTSMVRRHVIVQQKGTKRGFPVVYTRGPAWTRDWVDSHHEGPVTIEFIKARNGE